MHLRPMCESSSRFAAIGALLLIVALLATAPALPLLANQPGLTPATETTVDVPSTDPDMIDAQIKARASLDRFWAVQAAPRGGEEGFALKIAVPVRPGETEHVWTSDIARDGDKVFGRVSNTPKKARTLAAGQRVEIAADQISDWMYLRNGRIVGNFTLRPLLKRMPPAEADRYRAMLAEP